MILAINVGNTRISMALFKGGETLGIDRINIASVVPGHDRVLQRACRKVFGISPTFVTHKNIGIPIKGYNKKQVGADRLVNALAAYRRFKRAVMIVDIGTAISFDVVSSKGEFLGGAIAPGPFLQAGALHAMTAKLPLVKFKKPKRKLGKDTVEAIRSGIFYGTAGMIDRIVSEISRELRTKFVIIATGGSSTLIAPHCRTVRHIFPFLTLEGISLI